MESVYGSLFKTTLQLLHGVWRISRLPQPVVTIFGGARFTQEDPYAKKAHELAKKLVQNKISVLTGGGPGIMAAANCGALEGLGKTNKVKSIGITVKGLGTKEELNKCAQELITVDYFFTRKWLMVHNALAFAIFPGGFGTLDELGEIVTLMQTKKLPGVPIVLIGVEYWKPFIAWLQSEPLKHGLIAQQDLDMLQVTDDIDEAVEILKERCELCKI